MLCGDNQESISGAESADGCLHFHIHPNTTIKKQKSIQIQLSRNKTGHEKYKYNNRKLFCRRWMSTFSYPSKYNHQETKIHPYTTINKQKQYKTNKTSGRWMLTFSPLPIQGSIRKLKNVDACFFLCIFLISSYLAFNMCNED